MVYHQKVAIVIPTKNEEKNVGTCIRSIQTQTYPQELIECVVVDNFSTDRTVAVASQYIKGVYQIGPERCAQRNYGLFHKTTGEYVMYVDSDMILSPTLIETCVETMSEGHWIALNIPEIVLGTEFFSRARSFERAFYNNTVVDGARFFRRDIFERVGGFDENMTGPEDWDIDKKVKQYGSIGFVKEGRAMDDIRTWPLYSFIKERGIDPAQHRAVIFHNESDFVIRPYRFKKDYYGRSFSTYIEKWGKDDLDIRRQFGFYYRYISVFIENGKWRRLLQHPLLTCGMFVLRVLVGWDYFYHRVLRHKTRS